MEIDLLKVIYEEWATVAAHPQAFVAVLALGLLVGWAAAWLILRQRLIHHREMLEQYKEALHKKGPKPKVAPPKSPLPLFSKKQMIIGVCILIVCTTLPIYVGLRALGPNVDAIYRANLQFTAVIPWKAPQDALTHFNISVSNVGNLPAKHVGIQVAGIFSDHVLRSDEIRRQLNQLKKVIADADKFNPNQVVQLAQGPVVTLPGVTATADEFQQFMATKKLLYVFWVASYDDELRQGRSYWHTEFCGYFAGTLRYWHNCGPNRVELIQKPRFSEASAAG